MPAMMSCPTCAAVLERMRRFCDAIHRPPLARRHRRADHRYREHRHRRLRPRPAHGQRRRLAASPARDPHRALRRQSRRRGPGATVLLPACNRARTLFVIASKDLHHPRDHAECRLRPRLAGPPTLGEAAVARHFVAVSTNLAEVARFGIDPANAFEFWDWVGGPLLAVVSHRPAAGAGRRHGQLPPSCWPAAHAMDAHFFNTAPSETQPARLYAGTARTLECRISSAPTTAPCCPTASRWACCRAICSNWKWNPTASRSTARASPCATPAHPSSGAKPGTNGQHAFYQLIHQGGRLIPCEFIACKQADFDAPRPPREAVGQLLRAGRGADARQVAGRNDGGTRCRRPAAWRASRGWPRIAASPAINPQPPCCYRASIPSPSAP
jgi:glucose-6-phosphate isomerase